MFGKINHTDDHVNVRQIVSMIFLFVVLLFRSFLVRQNRSSRIPNYLYIFIISNCFLFL